MYKNKHTLFSFRYCESGMRLNFSLLPAPRGHSTHPCSALSIPPYPLPTTSSVPLPPLITHSPSRVLAQLEVHIILVRIRAANTSTGERAIAAHGSRRPNAALPPSLSDDNGRTSGCDLEIETRGAGDSSRGCGLATALLDSACDATADGEESNVDVVIHKGTAVGEGWLVGGNGRVG
jgi:hypothetical protein